ncbi:MAG: site-specific integrase, partial [Flavobacteriales bacterium]|nr:site-specific integrase [Flavobacteriales bacterium]
MHHQFGTRFGHLSEHLPFASVEWKQALTDFRIHLKLERSLSDRTVEAYVRDLTRLREF